MNDIQRQRDAVVADVAKDVENAKSVQQALSIIFLHDAMSTELLHELARPVFGLGGVRRPSAAGDVVRDGGDADTLRGATPTMPPRARGQ